MSNPRSERSRGFWIGGGVLVFLLHALAIFRLGDRAPKVPVWEKPRPFLYVGGDAAASGHLAELYGSRDPTLFALPHPHGFSGGAWLKFRSDVPKLTNWSAPPEWLAWPLDPLGGALGEYAATNRPAAEPLLAALRPPRAVEVRIPAEPLQTRTTARIAGPLAARPLTRASELPAAVHTDVLRPTAVAVAVNGEGRVESASLAAESGAADADQRAIELARRFEFQPLPLRDARARENAPPVIGRIIFTWQVLPPTNGAAAAARTP